MSNSNRVPKATLRSGRPSVVLVALLLIVTGLVVPVRVAAADTAPDLITIEGRGFGHGRGMGQWGALGYAIDHDWTYDQILDHFYGGTTFGDPIPNDDIKVHLQELDNTDLRVWSNSPFAVAGVDVPAGEAVRVRLLGENSFAVDRSPSCDGPWTETATVPGEVGQGGHPFVEIVPSVAEQGDDFNEFLIVCDAGGGDGGGRGYRGALRFVEIGLESFVINRLPVESYLRGVVPRESPSYWGNLGDGKGIEALKAQAVAARSYATAQAEWRRANGNYASDTCNTQSCQVYQGAWLNGLPLDYGTNFETTTTAVAATAGQVRRNADGSVSLTEFAAATGGWTAPQSEGNGYPAVEDLGDHTSINIAHEWTRKVPRSTIEAMYPEVGTLESIRVTERNGLGEWGGRVRQVEIRGSDQTVDIPIANWGADPFRRSLGLLSDWYRFTDFAPTEAEQQTTGFWLAKADGTVLGFGGAAELGDMSGTELKEPVVGLAPTPSGKGYWLVASDGGIFAFGDAEFFGSTGDLVLDEPIVGMAPTPSGEGYWLVASDGGIFAFGDAPFLGSMGGVRLNKPVVGMESTPSGEGYWLVASDGGIFAFGDAPFLGSTGDITLARPITGMTAHPDGRGYWFVAEDGGVFAFGQVGFHGSRGARTNKGTIVGMSVTPSGGGYWLVTDSGTSYPFGDAPDFISSVAGSGVVDVKPLP